MSTPPTPDLPKASRSGLWLFSLYLAVYAGFVYLAAFDGPLMAKRPGGGVSVAILYGMVLIASPLALALIYLRTARRTED